MKHTKDKIELIVEDLDYSIESKDFLTYNQRKELLEKEENKHFIKQASLIGYDGFNCFIDERQLETLKKFMDIFERFHNSSVITEERKNIMKEKFDIAFNGYIGAILYRETTITEFLFFSKVSKLALATMKKYKFSKKLVDLDDRIELAIAVKLFEFAFDDNFCQIYSPNEDLEEYAESKRGVTSNICSLFEALVYFRNRDDFKDNGYINEELEKVRKVVREMEDEIGN